MKKLFLVLISAFYIFAFLSSAGARDYRLAPDDVLQISVYREATLNRAVRVSSDGHISFPLLGEVKAEGLTVPELEKLLTERLKEYVVNPQVTVFLQSYSTITVAGEVENPGVYPLEERFTVSDAISRAGGFNKYASRNSVRLIRIENGKKKVYRVR
ncbi:MAG: polysaccharide biosynthesis/export family protein, partial [Candidatus Omnitrophota bacterium]